MPNEPLTLKYIPDRGDVVRINFDPQAGHEQVKVRPALVLSPLAYNKRLSLALCCPITSNSKGYTSSWEVVIPANLAVSGVILSDQVKSLDWKERKAKYICTLPSDVVIEVLAKLNTLLE
jgi:mRNA interferase MazF